MSNKICWTDVPYDVAVETFGFLDPIERYLQSRVSRDFYACMLKANRLDYHLYLSVKETHLSMVSVFISEIMKSVCVCVCVCVFECVYVCICVCGWHIWLLRKFAIKK